jgi:hypothetical protein
MRNVEFLKFEGKEICYFNFSGLKNELEIFDLITESNIYIHKKLPQSIYSLINMENIPFNDQIKRMLADFIKESKNYVKAHAIIGITGYVQLFFFKKIRFTNKNIQKFDNIKSAINWLVLYP